MPYWVYILESETSGRLYCGQTSDLDRRVAQHNDSGYTFTRTTKVFDGPWRLKWSFQCSCRTDAIKLERKIKRRGANRFLAEQTGGC